MSDPACGICERNADRGLAWGRTLWENDHWLLRHNRAPYGVAGWSVLYSKRHVAGIAHFNDTEVAQLGPLLRSVELLLEHVTGALRVYTAAMGETSPHFHAHLVPRYARTPGDVKAWELFGLLTAARNGAVHVDEAVVERICEQLAQRLPSQLQL
jgi:diadenosine tetraphosphate (Ap4A) HIT family hydrolase